MKNLDETGLIVGGCRMLLLKRQLTCFGVNCTLYFRHCIDLMHVCIFYFTDLDTPIFFMYMTVYPKKLIVVFMLLCASIGHGVQNSTILAPMLCK